jgi:hypothetical protein
VGNCPEFLWWEIAWLLLKAASFGCDNEMSQYKHGRVENFVLHWSDGLVDVPGSESLPEMNMLYGENDR